MIPSARRRPAVAKRRRAGRPGRSNLIARSRRRPRRDSGGSEYIKKIYHADPLRCPRCGGTMKIIAFIEARQGDLVRGILEHGGLWHDPPGRAPPTMPSPPTPGPKLGGLLFEPSSSLTYEVDPDFLEYQRRQGQEQPDLPFEP